MLGGALATVSIHAPIVASSEVHIAVFVALLLVVFGYAALSRPAPATTLSLTTFVFVVMALPTVTTGQLHGYDIWYYIETTKVILANGWNPTREVVNVNSYLYPGMQLFTALLSRMTDLSVKQAAEYIPILLKAGSILSIYAIVRLFTNPRHAVMAPLLVVGFYNYTTWLPYHHITYGYALKLLVLFVFLKVVVNSLAARSVDRPLVVVYLLLFLALLISHQVSTFHVGVLVGTAIIVLRAGAWYWPGGDFPVSQRNIEISTFLALFMGILFGYYYTDIGVRYIVALVSIQFGNIPAAQPDPLLVQKLSLIHQPTFIEKLTMSKLVVSVEVLSAVAVLAGILHFRRIQTWMQPHSLPLFITATCVGLLGVLTILDTLIPFTLGGLRRQFMLAVPFGTVFVGLVYEHSEGRSRQILQVAIPVCIALFFVVNMQMYPGYFVGDATAEDENRYERVMTEQRRAAYKWLPGGTRVYASTQARIYLQSTQSGVNVVENYHPYTGIPRFLRNGAFLLVREEFKSFLLMRSQPYQYRISESRYKIYDTTPGLNKVYSNNVTLYKAG